MAFTLRNLSVLAHAQGFTLWHYRSAADLLPAVGDRGFFDPAADVLNGGDMIIISAADGSRTRIVQATGSRVETVAMQQA